MTKHTLAFRRVNPDSIVDRLIGRFDSGPFCHVEIGLPGFGTFRVDESGCRFVGRCDYMPSMWELVDVDLLPEATLAACRMITGQRYDYLGVVLFRLRLAFRWAPPSNWGWFCSEAVSRIMDIGAYGNFIRPQDVSIIGPNELYRIVKGQP